VIPDTRLDPVIGGGNVAAKDIIGSIGKIGRQTIN
jgi:hypothetical protein